MEAKKRLSKALVIELATFEEEIITSKYTWLAQFGLLDMVEDDQTIETGIFKLF